MTNSDAVAIGAVSLTAMKVILAPLALILGGCMGYVPGQQSYWDSRVRELCNTDGGVRILQRVSISRDAIQRGVVPRYADGRLGVAPKELAHPEAPVYSVSEITYVRKESNPQVWRTENVVRRTLDNSVVARWVIYTRAGGDLPTGISHGSSLICPELDTIVTDLSKIYEVNGGSR